MSYPHRCQAAVQLDRVPLMVKGHECVSCLNGGQAAERLKCCIESNTLALTLIGVQPQCGLILGDKGTPQCTGYIVGVAAMGRSVA